MALSCALNNNYRPNSPLVTQKYTPLQNIQLGGVDIGAVQQMLQNRINAFTNLGIRIDRLTYLSVQTTGYYANLEVGKSPPLVVVSSNRSRWIKARYDNAVGLLPPGLSNFTDVMDTRVLAAGAVPIYVPVRLSVAEAAARNVYIFVATDEYTQYRNELAGTGIHVIGWRTEGMERASGFGASRYAALEFFKAINRQNGACGSMWMFDDNVAYIRSFPGLAAVEGQLAANVGLGFRGGTQAHTDPTFTQMSQNAQPGPVGVGTNIPAPILQQTVLWNVAQFNIRGVSFSPYFITSAEDTSLTAFLGLAVCRFYNGCEIFKGLPDAYDNTLGVQALNGSKRELLSTCYRQRNPVPYGCATVPNVNTLAQIIDAARDDPHSPPRIGDIATEETVGQTYSKSLEQTLISTLAQALALPGLFNLAQPQIVSKKTP